MFIFGTMNRNEIFSRSELLLGTEALEALDRKRVILFGVGGVGSWVAETLVRTGLTHLTLVDFDDVAPSNINRQRPATSLTVGRPKVEVMKQVLEAINPDAEIIAINALYTPETADGFNLGNYDYVIDAIDSLRDKALLIVNACRAHTKLYSSMGAALKTDPTKIRVDWFENAKGCRLAAALRQRFKRSGQYPAKRFRVVYSPEIVENRFKSGEPTVPSPIFKPTVNGSLMQVTAPFGITLASLVINNIAKKA